MKQILLTLGLVAKIDDDDFDMLSSISWHASAGGRTWYARHGTLLMHRFLMRAQDGIEVDHRDRNGLNCQRSNLRLATHAQNRRNNSLYASNTSGFKGVSWDRRTGKWMTFVHLDGRPRFIGRYLDIDVAAKAYDEAAERLHGEFALTNRQLREQA